MLAFFKRLFGQSDEKSKEDPGRTLPLTPPAERGASADPWATAPLESLGEDAAAGVRVLHRSFGQNIEVPRIVVSHAQSVGMVRDHNEDVLLTLTNGFGGHEGMPNFGLFVVADGMGGHSLGERASAVAARAIAQVVINEVYLPLVANPEGVADLPPLQELAQRAVETANAAVSHEVPQSGTTATMALVVQNRLVMAHVGDSRAYIITEGTEEEGLKLNLITRDHSLVGRLQELGQLTPEEAAVHPQRNVLYRAVGQGDGLEIDVGNHMVPRRSRLLICSDGLWGLVDDPEILGIIKTSGNSQIACERLVAAANEAGGPDNITAVMVDFN